MNQEFTQGFYQLKPVVDGQRLILHLQTSQRGVLILDVLLKDIEKDQRVGLCEIVYFLTQGSFG